MPLNQIRPFVGMTVAGEQQVHAVRLENRHGVTSRTTKWRRTPSESWQPLLYGGTWTSRDGPLGVVVLEVPFQPLDLGAARFEGGDFTVQHDEVDVAVIEGIEMLDGRRRLLRTRPARVGRTGRGTARSPGRLKRLACRDCRWPGQRNVLRSTVG